MASNTTPSPWIDEDSVNPAVKNKYKTLPDSIPGLGSNHPHVIESRSGQTRAFMVEYTKQIKRRFRFALKKVPEGVRDALPGLPEIFIL